MSAVAAASLQAEAEALVEELGTMTAAAARLGVSRTTIAKRRRGSGRTSQLPCPDCGEPMREPAPRCGFCEAEAKEAA